MQPSGLRDTTRLLPGLKAVVSDVEKSMKNVKFVKCNLEDTDFSNIDMSQVKIVK